MLSEDLEDFGQYVGEFGRHVQLMGCLLAKRAELEGMIAANRQRDICGHSLAHSEQDFIRIEKEIDTIVGPF